MSRFRQLKALIMAAESIAIAEGLSEGQLELLLTAALLHDTGFLKKREDHETESCKIAQLLLPGFNYAPDEIALICGMIKATQIPQSPITHLQQILCDADLDYLGRDDFFILSNRLFLELCKGGLVKNEQEWNNIQANFMEAHRYHTKTSQRLKSDKKQAHLTFIKSKISNSILNENQ